MRVAVDVMGGEKGCLEMVAGAVEALRAQPDLSRLFLVGRQDEIEAALRQSPCQDPRLQIVHASEILTMEDKPVDGFRRKKDCSISRGIDLIKDGQAQAFISPGNTGGVVAAAAIKLRTLPEVERPAIAAVIPVPEHEFLLLDAGANVECRPLHLLQYAIMGSVFSREILGCPQPRVGLLSVGTEDTKGNELTLETFKLCKKTALNFIGNVEGHDLFDNRVDVVVCDGFVGNVVLKTCESLAMNLFGWLKHELTRNPVRLLGAWLARGAFRSLKHRLNPEGYGGAQLLGLNGTVIIAHGSSSSYAIKNGIRLATEAYRHNINQIMVTEIAAAKARLASEPLPPPPA